MMQCGGIAPKSSKITSSVSEEPDSLAREHPIDFRNFLTRSVISDRRRQLFADPRGT
jgi:hypothetical protein